MRRGGGVKVLQCIEICSSSLTFCLNLFMHFKYAIYCPPTHSVAWKISFATLNSKKPFRCRSKTDKMVSKTRGAKWKANVNKRYILRNKITVKKRNFQRWQWCLLKSQNIWVFSWCVDRICFYVTLLLFLLLSIWVRDKCGLHTIRCESNFYVSTFKYDFKSPGKELACAKWKHTLNRRNKVKWMKRKMSTAFTEIISPCR